jgi:hypothetical protein
MVIERRKNIKRFICPMPKVNFTGNAKRQSASIKKYPPQVNFFIACKKKYTPNNSERNDTTKKTIPALMYESKRNGEKNSNTKGG